MAINPELSPLTPAEAAEAVAVGVQSIRRWCEWHAGHLSVGASPGPGIPRRLTQRDVEVLKVVKELRYQGLQTDAINDRLKSMAFPEIADSADSDSAVTVADSVEATPGAQARQGGAIVPKVEPEFITSIERRFAALERSAQEQRATWWHVAVGIGIGLGMAAVAELFALVARR